GAGAAFASIMLDRARRAVIHHTRYRPRSLPRHRIRLFRRRASPRTISEPQCVNTASPTIIVLTADKERSSRDLPFAAGLQRTVSRLVFAQFISRRLVIQIWSALCPSAAKPRRFQGLS